MHSLQELDLENICSNCRTKHNNNFESFFDNHTKNAHYKNKICEHCGYEISFRTKDTSGI